MTYKAGESLSDGVWKLFLARDLGYSDAAIGELVGTWGMVFSLAGSFAGGIVASRTTLLRAVSMTAILRVFPIAAQWGVAAAGRPSFEALVAVTCAEHFFGGALTTAMFAFMMSRVDRSVGGSHFTAFATVEVAGKLAAGAASGWIASARGFVFVFQLATALSALFLVLLLPLRTLPPVGGRRPDVQP